ncbi:MAG: hypothetical protein AAF633_00520 [Chloroflexota bacterium]
MMFDQSVRKRAVRLAAVLVLIASITAVLAAQAALARPTVQEEGLQEMEWALEETFDGDPAAPSQDLLPDNFNYVITHRTHPQEQFTKAYPPYPADHGNDCTGPNPEIVPLPQHMVTTKQSSNSTDRDESFFICKNHMMTAIGDVDPYSVSAFWPRQAFDFSDGGTLEFEVNVNLGHTVKHWWEVMIVPRDQLKLGSGPIDSPIDETYPSERIVFDFRRLVRGIKVGSGELAPEGWIVKEQEWLEYDFAYWNAKYPEDPAISDRRIRRTMRIYLEDEQIIWSIETADGSFDDYVVEVPGGLPFEQGLVVFKTHSYDPLGQGNVDTYTFHWDNIRFDGPVVGLHDSFDADDVVYLQANGSRQIGETETVNITLPRIGDNPMLMGQVHQGMKGQVLLSINGRPDIVIEPFEYERPDCLNDDWGTFQIELDPSWINVGENSFKWTIGPRPECAETGDWDGFSIKALQVHMDSEGSVPSQETPEPEPTAEAPYPGPNGFNWFLHLPFMKE